MDILPDALLASDSPAPQEPVPRRLGPPVEVIEAGARLDLFLAKKFQFLARHGWQQRIRAGRVFVNGIVTSCSYRLRAGDELSHLMPPGAEPETCSDLELIYQSERLLAVCKPPNLPMHEGGFYHLSTLVHFARQQFGQDWSPVHRLDLETSGLVLCTADPATREFIARQFRNRTMRKSYVFLTRHNPPDSEWFVNQPLGRIDVEGFSRQWISPDGQTAETRFEWVESRGDLHLIRAYPRTGRTLQIRIHASWSGVPILGDRLCHPDQAVYLAFKTQHDDARSVEIAGHWRSCLHSESLEFIDPESGCTRRLESKIYPDMQELWTAAEQGKRILNRARQDLAEVAV